LDDFTLENGATYLLPESHLSDEKPTPELFYEVIKENFPKFAVHLSKINTNPINYF
jgi:ectoine hydroxylase-related dioxygenase (phytanoyl-CoA dioxygenase family)